MFHHCGFPVDPHRLILKPFSGVTHSKAMLRRHRSEAGIDEDTDLSESNHHLASGSPDATGLDAFLMTMHASYDSYAEVTLSFFQPNRTRRIALRIVS